MIPGQPQEGPQYPDFVKDAALFDELIKSEHWKRFIARAETLAKGRRVESDVPAPTRRHPEYTLGVLFAIDLLTSIPESVIRQRDKFVADESARKQAASESSQSANDEPIYVRPPPQAM